jgi:hypothetical protein
MSQMSLKGRKGKIAFDRFKLAAVVTGSVSFLY